jgi:hypothetical protein
MCLKLGDGPGQLRTIKDIQEGELTNRQGMHGLWRARCCVSDGACFNPLASFMLCSVPSVLLLHMHAGTAYEAIPLVC